MTISIAKPHFTRDIANREYTLTTAVARPDIEQLSVTHEAKPVPLWLSEDGQTLYVTNLTATLVQTRDDGVTSVDVKTFASGVVNGCRTTGDGELLVVTDSPAKLWKSTGYIAKNPTAASWAEVLAPVASGATFPAIYGGVSCYENLVVINEYGPRGSDNARRVWLSQDYGATFAVILDIGEGDGNSHVHSCAYDPYWGYIWVVTGDAFYLPENASIRYSPDLGATWTTIVAPQCLSIMPMPNCILFGTDDIPNGIRRITRLSNRQLGPVETVYKIDEEDSLTSLGMMPYRRGEGFPALFPFRSSATYADVGRVVATNDGISFYEIWTDDLEQAALGLGATAAVGPTADGNIFIRSTAGIRISSRARATCPKWETTAHKFSHAPTGKETLTNWYTTATERFIAPSRFQAIVGTPVNGIPTGLKAPYWLFDPNTDERIVTTILVPEWATKCTFDFYWSNASTGTGVCAWYFATYAATVGASAANAPLTAVASNVTADAQDVLLKSRIGTVAVTGGDMLALVVWRNAVAAADTLANDVKFYGLLPTFLQA